LNIKIPYFFGKSTLFVQKIFKVLYFLQCPKLRFKANFLKISV